MKPLFLASIVITGVGVGCRSTASQSDPVSAPVTVSLAKATMADLPSLVEAGGIVRAHATVSVASRVMAPITEVRVRPGDRVRRGAVLVTLDAREFQANQGRAVASSLSAAEAVRAADADVRAAESALVLARATHDRVAALHGKRSATPQELDQAIAAVAAAEAQRAGAQARLAAANAARDAAAASAEAAAIGVTYTVLTSPFDGIVTERHADPGSMAAPGAPLLVLDDPATYRLEVQLDEARASLVAAGQIVSVRLDNVQPASSAWIDARVDEVGRVDPVSHGFVVKIALPPFSTIRSGLFGRARFASATRQALTIPQSALVSRGQLTFLYIVDRDGRARLRPISPGVLSDQRLEVLAGVRDGDIVVQNPPPSLTDGSRVAGGRS